MESNEDIKGISNFGSPSSRRFIYARHVHSQLVVRQQSHKAAATSLSSLDAEP